MGDTRFLPGLVLVALAAAFALVALLAGGLSRPGRGRAGLIAGGLPLSLLPPVVAAACGSWMLERLLSELLQREPGGGRGALDALASLWAVQRIAWGATLGLCLAGLLVGLLRLRAAPGVPGSHACSLRRALVLLLLPALALTVAGVASRPLAGALRVTAALVSSEPGDREAEARLEAVLHAQGLQARGAGWLGGVSRFLARARVIGVFGGATAALVLLGLALPGFILAWRVEFAGPFSIAASALWLFAAVSAGLAALGVLDPLRLA